jgi:PDGLE domain
VIVKPSLSNRQVGAVAVLLIMLIAGGLSLFASGAPDGLNRVAEDTGIAQTEREHPTDGPLADYAVDGWSDNAGRVAAGLLGACVVGGAMMALTRGVRR